MPGGGENIIYPGKKVSKRTETQNRGHNNISPVDTPPERLDTKYSGDTHPIPRIKQLVPGRAPFDAPRSLSLAAAPFLSPWTPRAAVWGDHGTGAQPREVEWRSREPVLRSKICQETALLPLDKRQHIHICLSSDFSFTGTTPRNTLILDNNSELRQMRLFNRDITFPVSMASSETTQAAGLGDTCG